MVAGIYPPGSILMDDVNGVMIVNWEEAKVAAIVATTSRVAAIEAANEVLQLANTIVPYKTGRLEGTGQVTPKPMNKGIDEQSAIISYGTDYAVRLHENPQFHFRNGRQGKWLEKALRFAQHGVMAVMVSTFTTVFKAPNPDVGLVVASSLEAASKAGHVVNTNPLKGQKPPSHRERNG